LSDVDFHFRQLLSAGTASASVALRPSRYRIFGLVLFPQESTVLRFSQHIVISMIFK